MNLRSCILLSLLLSLMSGCGLSGEVIDFSDKTTEMKKIELIPSGVLKVLDGYGTREISLDDVNRLILLPQDSRTVENELYYMAEIILKDGTEIGTEAREHRRIKAFVAISPKVRGMAKGGMFEIPLSEVSELNLVD